MQQTRSLKTAYLLLLAIAPLMITASTLVFISSPVILSSVYGTLEADYVLAGTFGVLGLVLIPRPRPRPSQGGRRTTDVVADLQIAVQEAARDHAQEVYQHLVQNREGPEPRFVAGEARRQLRLRPLRLVHDAIRGLLGTYSLGMAAGIFATALSHTGSTVAEVSTSTLLDLGNGLLLDYPTVLDPSPHMILPDNIVTRHAHFFVKTVGPGLLLFSLALSIWRALRLLWAQAGIGMPGSSIRELLEAVAAHAFADTLLKLNLMAAMRQDDAELSRATLQSREERFSLDLWRELNNLGHLRLSEDEGVG